MMKISGMPEREYHEAKKWITYPWVFALNSGETARKTRESVIQRLSSYQDSRWLMTFFMSPTLHDRYPRDLESTALLAAGRYTHDWFSGLDHDFIRDSIWPNGILKTWVGKDDQPLDYTSQMIMYLCYSHCGIDMESVRDFILRNKFSDEDIFFSRDTFYGWPLLLLYFTIYMDRRDELPKTFYIFAQRFIESYIPRNQIEKNMIAKICREFHLIDPQTIAEWREDSTLFTNGSRPISYTSHLVWNLLNTSALGNRRELIKPNFL